MAETRHCCAHGCSATSKNSPFRDFYTLTQVRGSLTEWLLALNRLDILADFTIRRKADSFSICATHFPSLQREPTNKTYTRGPLKTSINKETQTGCEYISTLNVTPVEIVDIQPEPISSVALNLDAFTIPVVPGPSNVMNAATDALSNNNVPGFIGAVIPAQAQPQASKKGPPSTLRRIKPKVYPIPGYLVKLNNLETMPAMMNVVDTGFSNAGNNIQPCVGNLNLTVDKPVLATVAAPPEASDDEVQIIPDVLHDPIKIEDDLPTQLVEDHEKYVCDVEKSDFEDDIVRIQFPTTEADSQGDGEHYVKFEVEETTGDEMETYCFFDDTHENTAKRRKVSTDGGFQIVNIEFEPDRTII